MTCDLGHGHGSYLALLSVYCVLTVAALIPSTAWDLLSSLGVALSDPPTPRGGGKQYKEERRETATFQWRNLTSTTSAR